MEDSTVENNSKASLMQDFPNLIKSQGVKTGSSAMEDISDEMTELNVAEDSCGMEIPPSELMVRDRMAQSQHPESAQASSSACRVPENDYNCLDKVRIQMLARVAVSDAHFKHQQRGEPDLTLEEKIEIAQNILDKSKINFLSRFGAYLELEDLEYFSDSRDVYEIDFYVKKITKDKSGNHRRNQVQNRRYEALKELVRDGDYFSEEEMKYREPYLYDQMIGQYLTEEEIQAKVDKSDLRFSTILISHIDQLNENTRYASAKNKEEGQEEEEEEEDGESDMEMEDKEEGGNKLNISEEQKQQLKEEFRTLMHEKFLSGQDKGFDYSKVDNNEDYDNLDVLDQDEQEKYFEDD